MPVGVFLSGGLILTVAAIASDICGSENTHTFSIGFRELGFNEADDARDIAQYLGTQHHELTVSSVDAFAFPIYPRFMTNRLPTRHNCRPIFFPSWHGMRLQLLFPVMVGTKYLVVTIDI